MLDLVDALDKKEDYSEIQNLGLNSIRSRIDLNELPPLDRELYYKYPALRDFPVRSTMVTRGCPYACSFCFNHQVNRLYSGNPVRRKSIENSIAELKELKKYRTRCIMFWDDTFTLDKNWLFVFLKAYLREIGLPFFCNVRAEHLDEETVVRLKKAGVYTVDFGVETGNEERRKALNKTTTNQQFLEAAKLLHKYRIYIQSENMLGLPGETLKTAWETFKFNKKIKPTNAWSSIFKPYPRLELKSSFEIKDTTYYKNSMLDMPREICNLQKLFSVGMRLPDFLVRFLIKLPLRRIYWFIFLIFYGFGLKKLFNLNYKDIAYKGLAMLKGYK